MNRDFPHPKDVADKAVRGNLSRALDLALGLENDALRLNTQTFNANRYKATARLDDYEELKDHARAIKEEALRDLPELITVLTNSIERRGGKVFYARTNEEAVAYALSVCKAHHARLVVKAKSITTEEIGLNRTLAENNIEVAETDLAEFILQVSEEQPSHIVAPAIHRSRERISRLFKEHFQTDKPLETGEQLTEFARDILRRKFLAADVGISGANLLGADDGSLLLVESEGNIRLTTQLPAIHIAIAGIEKIIPSRTQFGTFIELLAASATGQPLSTYTNVLQPPLDLPVYNLNEREDRKREFHLVLVDNGRLTLRDDKDLREALYCIRCSACMNVCANFQAVGGHAFGGKCYTGGIGGAWTLATTGSLQSARFADLCTGCSRCVPNCPVRIDIPHLNTVLKDRLIREGEPSLQKQFFGRVASLAKLASRLPSIANWITTLPLSKTAFERLFGVARQRNIPSFAHTTLETAYRAYRRESPVSKRNDHYSGKAILFADIYTNYYNPRVGMATIRVFDTLGIPLTLSKAMDDGRASQSQGLIALATKNARGTASYLASLIDEGYDILFAEPSVLAMARSDYRGLLHDDAVCVKLQRHCYDPIEFINTQLRAGVINIDVLKQLLPKSGIPLFYHAHCQMRSIGLAHEVPVLFEQLGFTVAVSTAECCGMAGSFGYKKQYYELSANIGRDLTKQIPAVSGDSRRPIILASGTSCREQLTSELSETVYHPIELLDQILQPK